MEGNLNRILETGTLYRFQHLCIAGMYWITRINCRIRDRKRQIALDFLMVGIDCLFYIGICSMILILLVGHRRTYRILYLEWLELSHGPHFLYGLRLVNPLNRRVLLWFDRRSIQNLINLRFLYLLSIHNWGRFLRNLFFGNLRVKGGRRSIFLRVGWDGCCLKWSSWGRLLLLYLLAIDLGYHFIDLRILKFLWLRGYFRGLLCGWKDRFLWGIWFLFYWFVGLFYLLLGLGLKGKWFLWGIGRMGLCYVHNICLPCFSWTLIHQLSYRDISLKIEDNHFL